jgi:hypothetical protein
MTRRVKENIHMRTSHDVAGRVAFLTRTATGLVVTIAAVALGACSNLLDVKYPGRIPIEQVNNPTLASVLVDGVVGDFECAYNNYVGGAAVHSDEYQSASDNGLLANWGERNITAENDDYAVGQCEANTSDFGLHVPMHTARFQAEDVFKRLAGWTDAQVPGRLGLQATVRAFAGYAYTLLGETYCSIAFDKGAPQPPAASLTIAVARFTEAIALAGQAGAGSADIVGLANVGLARANLDLKNWAAAATFAAKVRDTFEFFADRGIENDRRWNKIQYFATDLGAFVISDPYRTMNDPRVLVKDAKKPAFNPYIDLWVTTKYGSLGDPIRLASYREARLILAEANAMLGDVGGAMSIINGRRGQVGLPPLVAANQSAAIDHIIEERRKELSFEGGHRLNDLIRKNISWKVGRNPFTSRPYGSTTCWPIPIKETNGN